uniref:Malic enzyme n=1 Tax=Cladonia uncialis subsp. uncialis TaxID=180999 RepID=A0A2K9YE01_CLAUC|nr:putative malic enzyme [Cladonia uncialis subsp. uncialis]
MSSQSHPKDTKHPRFGHLPLSTSGPEECALTGTSLLRSPYHNKGSAFPQNERKDFKLYGLLPPNVQTLDEQVKRAYEQYSKRGNALGKNTFMTSMKDQNEVLYYKLIQEHLKEMFSIIYTPTEGEAIQNFSQLFRRPEGCFLNIDDRDRVEDNLAQWGGPEDIDYIVVTDGEEALEIKVPTGVISYSQPYVPAYTPQERFRSCLIVELMSVNSVTIFHALLTRWKNDQLLKDELYLGLRKPRTRGEDEDFGLTNARRILDNYRPKIACFNDDVQGTGCITLAAILSGLHVGKLKLSDMRLVIFGSGTAGIGIADQVRDAIAAESGKSKEDAAKRIWCVDKPGLLLKSMADSLTIGQGPFARDDKEWHGKDHKDLLSVIKEVKPHVLIGTSTKPKAFTEEVVKEMSKHVERPIVLPLSNPTRLHEAEPKDIYEWSEGRALIATGSPFPPVEYRGKKYEVAECNNSTAFPGIGLGNVLSRSKLLSDKMLVAAVKAIAAQSPALKDPDKGLVPDITDVREMSVHIAKAVIQQAVEEGLATEKEIPQKDEDLEEWIREQMWEPRYRPLMRVEKAEASTHGRGELGSGGVAKQAK